MNEKLLGEKISWLGDKLIGKRDILSRMLSRLRAFGESVGGNLGWHKKLSCLMEQIADEREKEVDLIYEIDKMEKRHREMKRARLLKQADASLADRVEKRDAAPMKCEEKEEPEVPLLVKLMGLWYFFSPPCSSNRIEPRV